MSVHVAMALRNEDKDWIFARIQDAIAELKPQGWRRFLKWLRDWSLVGANITVIVALLAVAFGALYFGITTGRSMDRENTQFRTRTEDRLAAIETSLLALRTSKAATDPANRKNQIEAKEILATARKSSIVLPEPVLQESAEKFIGANDPNAWSTALEFVAYRSFANGFSPRIPLIPVSITVTTDYQTLTPTGRPAPIVQHFGAVPQKEAARFNQIGSNQNADKPFGDQLLVVTGGEIILDNMDLKNVVLKNVVVHYSGGPLKIDNVYFVNCRFEMQQVRNSESLAQAILTEIPVISFSTT